MCRRVWPWGPSDGRTGKRVKEKESIEMLTQVKMTAMQVKYTWIHYMARRIKIVQIKTSTTAQNGVTVVETGFTLPPETITKPEKRQDAIAFITLHTKQ